MRSIKNMRYYSFRCIFSLTSGLLLSSLAGALPIYDTENLTVEVKSKISYGQGRRMEGRSPDFISIGNGGTREDSLRDDGDLNYNEGDVYTEVVKGVHRFEMDFKRIGFVAEYSWWKDYSLKEKEVPHGNVTNMNLPGHALDLSGATLRSEASGGVWGERHLILRLPRGGSSLYLGDRVFDVGTMMLFRSPLNDISPLDAAVIRRPGSSLFDPYLPEGRIPVRSVSFESKGDEYALSAAFLAKWEPYNIDHCGTFFSTSDFVAPGCGAVSLISEIPDSEHYDTDLPINIGSPWLPIVVPRGKDVKPDAHEYFVKLSKMLGESVEASAYYARLNGRLPIMGVWKSESGDSYASGGTDMRYAFEYPEEIDHFGVSGSLKRQNIKVEAEIVYSKDMPVAIYTGDVLSGAVYAPGAVYEEGEDHENSFYDDMDAAAPGAFVSGYKRFNIVQGALSVSGKLSAGSFEISPRVEVAGVSVINYQSKGSYLFGNGEVSDDDQVSGDLSTDGFMTRNSYGVRSVLPINVKFTDVSSLTLYAAYRDDVKGFSPGPNSLITEGVREFSAGLIYRGGPRGSLVIGMEGAARPVSKFDPSHDRDHVKAWIAMYL